MTRATIFLSVLTACGPTSDPVGADAGTSFPELVPGALQLAPQADRPADEAGSGIVVAGAARDGDRIAILAIASPPRGAPRTRLFLSDDRGASFRQLAVSDSPTHTASDVALGGGRIAIILAGEGSRLSIAEVGDDGTLGLLQPLGLAPHVIDGAIVAAPADFGLGTLTVARYDVASGALTMHTSDAPARACTSWLFDRDADGAWRRFCYATAERCVDTVDPEGTGTSPTASCVASRTWPIPQRLEQAQWRLPSGVWLIHSEDGHAHALRATSVTGETIPDGVDLGPGYLLRTWSGLLWFEPATGASGGPRLIDLSGDGSFRELALARSPCLVPEACGPTPALGQLTRVLSLGAGRWLAMYVINNGSEAALVVREVGEQDVPASPITEGGAPRMRQPREPVEATGELEIACARALACGLSEPMAYCLARWEEVNGASASGDSSYRRFVETPVGDCEAWRETWPEAFTPAGTCPASCVGDVAVQCSPGGAGAIDCARRGTSCRVADSVATCGPDASAETCNVCDPTGRAVQCLGGGTTLVTDCPALGLQCFDDPDRPENPACTTGIAPGCTMGSPVCDGDIALLCASDGHVRQRIACDRLGMICRGGECEPPGSSAPACDVDGTSACEGPLVTYCLGGERRYVDCIALGMTGCQDAPVVIGVPARAWCVL